jgi:Mor family transcriptional regulator
MVNLSQIIEKEDIKEPYNVLVNVLTIDQIIKLANTLDGLEINFINIDFKNTKDFKLISRCLNKKLAMKVFSKYYGERIYFQSFKRAISNKLNSIIKSEYDGYNTREIAIKYNYSERQIRRIAKGHKKNNSIMDGQISLFD